MGTLYLVSTPIGNMEDITLRAIRVLYEVDVIACEDTRKTGILLSRLKEIQPPTTIQGRTKASVFISYYEENEQKRIPEIVQLIKLGKNAALVSSSGTPTISDPGFKLIRECLNHGIEVVSIPGASAILAALVSSGLPTDKFLFLGFLPLKPGKRQKIWNLLTTLHTNMDVVTIIVYESPYRLLKTLCEIKQQFGNIDIVICRELTKIHEEIRREKVSNAIDHFEEIKPRGEFTLLLNSSNYSDPGSE